MSTPTNAALEIPCGKRLKAVLFDVDGTLYGQRALRTFMLGKLLKQVAADPRTGIRTILVESLPPRSGAAQILRWAAFGTARVVLRMGG